MVKFTINGLEIEAEKGQTLLDVATQHGIRIPTLCYHIALSGYSACRLCMVEVTKRGRKKFSASCTYPVEEGIEVKTDSEDVIKIRKLIMESLLAQAPNSEEIKDLARELGVENTRFGLNEDLENKCILCGLCVRVCRERMNVSAIGFAGRGANRKIATPFDKLSDVCITCGACSQVCPTDAIILEDISKNKPIPISNEFDMGLTSRSSIYVPFPQAVPLIYAIDKDRCRYLQSGNCGVCAETCKAEAIDYEQVPQISKLNVGAIIAAPGFEAMDPSVLTELGYGNYTNVVTAMEFERFLSATGPTKGKVLRPSDQQPPTRLAFIQCVGSRNAKLGNEFCSAVCCMYAIKEAIIAKEHLDKLEITIFFMDIRAFGKEFEDYYNRAQDVHDIEFIRSRVASITEEAQTRNVMLRFAAEDGEVADREFDMVVLSIGLQAPKMAKELSQILDIDLEEHNFCKTSSFTPLETSKSGIFVSGAFSGPKDIPDSVAQASGAAALAASIISSARGELVEPKVFPTEQDVRWKRPRIGVFVCHCGINIGGVVDVPATVEFSKRLPGVVYAEDNLYTCSQDSQERIKNLIEEHDLNRVVIASCTPRTHEPLFQNTIRDAGLNPYLFEMANIRDQCSWVHMHDPKAATEKAKDLVHMAVEKAYMLEPLKKMPLKVNKSALVIGGGVSGLTAAHELGKQGFTTHLVERNTELGGNLRNIYSLLDDNEPQIKLNKLIESVSTNDKIQIHTGAKILDINGYVGNFKTRLELCETDVEEAGSQGSPMEIEHGVVVVATGGVEYQPEEFLYSKDPKIITQSELENLFRLPDEEVEKKIGKKIDDLNNIVMIQCVGSRNETRTYCSRICCSVAIKNALHIKDINPNVNIQILYRDIRTYGLREKYYYQAGEKGVKFTRFDAEQPPSVDLDSRGNLKVQTYDHVLGSNIELKPDLLVLSTAILPQQDNDDLAKMLKVPLSKDGFFLEAHMKLRPVDFATDGVFLCGLAHSSKFVDECISQAAATAARAATVLSKDVLESEGIISFVNEDKCRGCGLCVEACPYNAIELKDVNQFGNTVQVASVNDILCKGCGTCVAGCLSGAIQQHRFEDRQIMAMIESYLAPMEEEPEVGSE